MKPFCKAGIIIGANTWVEIDLRDSNGALLNCNYVHANCYLSNTKFATLQASSLAASAPIDPDKPPNAPLGTGMLGVSQMGTEKGGGVNLILDLKEQKVNKVQFFADAQTEVHINYGVKHGEGRQWRGQLETLGD
mgnify:FL=1